MTIYAAIIAGILIGFALVAIVHALIELLSNEDDCEEMEWFALDEDGRV